MPVRLQSLHPSTNPTQDFVSPSLVWQLKISKIVYSLISTLITGQLLYVAATAKSSSIYTLLVAFAVFANGCRMEVGDVITIESMIDIVIDHTLMIASFLCNSSKWNFSFHHDASKPVEIEIDATQNLDPLFLDPMANDTSSILTDINGWIVTLQIISCLWKHCTIFWIYEDHVENRKAIEGENFNNLVKGPLEAFVYKLYDNVDKAFFCTWICCLMVAFEGIWFAFILTLMTYHELLGDLVFYLFILIPFIVGGYIIIREAVKFPVIQNASRFSTEMVLVTANIVTVMIGYSWYKMSQALFSESFSKEEPLAGYLTLRNSVTLYFDCVVFVNMYILNGVIQVIFMGIYMTYDGLRSLWALFV